MNKYLNNITYLKNKLNLLLRRDNILLKKNLKFFWGVKLRLLVSKIISCECLYNVKQTFYVNYYVIGFNPWFILVFTFLFNNIRWFNTSECYWEFPLERDLRSIENEEYSPFQAPCNDIKQKAYADYLDRQAELKRQPNKDIPEVIKSSSKINLPESKLSITGVKDTPDISKTPLSNNLPEKTNSWSTKIIHSIVPQNNNDQPNIKRTPCKLSSVVLNDVLNSASKSINDMPIEQITSLSNKIHEPLALTIPLTNPIIPLKDDPEIIRQNLEPNIPDRDLGYMKMITDLVVNDVKQSIINYEKVSGDKINNKDLRMLILNIYEQQTSIKYILPHNLEDMSDPEYEFNIFLSYIKNLYDNSNNRKDRNIYGILGSLLIADSCCSIRNDDTIDFFTNDENFGICKKQFLLL